MKLIIAGGRNYRFSLDEYTRLEFLHMETPITEVVCGGASGADEEGKVWAQISGIPVKEFPADWKNLGLKAGPLRNKAMAEYADAVVLFPGGKGTESMFQEARKAGIKIYDWRK